ncbi:Na+/H+ antiporter NhaA [Spartinivicinus ruber]|uniref:Na+/H+ antiporter NhaA n=1 Tax=Spartinivicinus ruber TaxID=2683272 RepID=UPI001CA43E11|nr:Na+/H+ antiporter NhaA [Spartinivicinus ruber]
MKSDNQLNDRGHPTQLPKELIDWLARPVKRFLHIETAVGWVLLLFTIAALVLSNSSWSHIFMAIWEIPIGIHIGSLEFSRSLREWINEALMTLFFFLIALELKRELVLGELRTPCMAALPIAAALGGS